MASRKKTMEEVQKHNTHNDMWIVIENKVYDLTQFQKKHPGGMKILEKVAGTDATKEFRNVGHSTRARTLMAEFCIGELVAAERKQDCG